MVHNVLNSSRRTRGGLHIVTRQPASSWRATRCTSSNTDTISASTFSPSSNLIYRLTSLIQRLSRSFATNVDWLRYVSIVFSCKCHSVGMSCRNFRKRSLVMPLYICFLTRSWDALECLIKCDATSLTRSICSYHTSVFMHVVDTKSKSVYDASYWSDIISQQVHQLYRHRFVITRCSMNANAFVIYSIMIF